MRNLLLLIAKYGSTIVFILLEVICFYIIISFNQSQGEIWKHSTNLLSGNINERVQNTSDYFALEAINDSLLTENAKLLESIINYRVFSKENEFQDFESLDSNLIEYKFVPARITNKTFNKRNNYITLNKGLQDSVKIGMGVISSNGIVGIVKNVSNHYSLVMSILHSQSKISAAIKNNDFHGTLVWDEMDPKKIKLISLPKHASVNVGDTIVTSGYSTVFPYGIEIGKVHDYAVETNEDSFEVEVDLFNDIPAVTHAYIIQSIKLEEKNEIESEAEDEL